MEDVLEVYSRPYDKDYPVICMDEKPVQFFSDFRKGFRSKKNGVQYEDYQYIRNGTASIFHFTEPLAGWRYADAQERRTAQDWAKQIEWLLTKQYPMAKKIVLVMDSLNTHSIAWLCSEFSVNARFHDKTVHILRSSEPEAEAEPPPLAARSVLDRLA